MEKGDGPDDQGAGAARFSYTTVALISARRGLLAAAQSLTPLAGGHAQSTGMMTIFRVLDSEKRPDRAV